MPIPNIEIIYILLHLQHCEAVESNGNQPYSTIGVKLSINKIKKIYSELNLMLFLHWFNCVYC